jgi:hypothetical protein
MTNILERWRRRRHKAPDNGAGASDAIPAADGLCLDPYETLAHVAAKAPRAFSWSRAGVVDPRQWQEMARVKLAELSGYGRFGGPPQVLRRQDLGVVAGLHHQSVYIRVRHAHDIPVRLVYRDADTASPRAAVLCLQGEGIGMHGSWGESEGSTEAQAVRSGFDFAREAAARGHIAVCVELMGAGDRRPLDPDGRPAATLRSLAVHGMLLGHSLLGQHASDVSTVINWASGGDVGVAVDPGRIAVIGHELGGAAGLLAAALDTRIAVVVMAEPPRRFRDAIKQRSITAEMTMPGLLRWMDLDDILLLCAPRPVILGPGRSGAAAGADDLVAAGRSFYELFEAGPVLVRAEALASLWRHLAAHLAESGVDVGKSEQ